MSTLIVNSALHDVPAALQACDGGVQVVLEEGPNTRVLDVAPPPAWFQFQLESDYKQDEYWPSWNLSSASSLGDL